MAHKPSLPHFHVRLPPGVVDVAVFVFSVIAIAAAAGLAAGLVPWS